MEAESGVLRELKDGVRHNRWPLLILTAMVLLFFGRFFRSDTIFMMRDLFLKHYPLHIFAREVLRHGALPLWNPFTGCGEPFLANIEGAVWYPPNLLYLALPVTLATAILVAFHTWLTGVAGYALCRVWKVSRLGSLLAATMLSFNTHWLTRIEFLPWHASIAWFPVVFLLYALWARSRRRRWIVLAALALGVQLLAGYPEGTLFPLGAMGLYALMLGIWAWNEQKRWRAFAAPIAAFAAMIAIGALLAMAQILPTLELARASLIRSGVMDPEVANASVNPLMLGTLLMPFLYGAPGYLGRYWAPSCFEYWTGSFYVGAAAIVLLVGALLMWLAALGGPEQGRTGGESKRPPEAHAGAAERPSAMPPWLKMGLSFLLYLGVLLIVMAFARVLKAGDDVTAPGWLYSLGMFAFLVVTLWMLIQFAALVADPQRSAGTPIWLRVRAPFLLALLAISIPYAMGRYTPVFNLFWYGLPFLQKFRWPSKSMICAVFALSVLAGMALDYLRESPERAEREGRKLERELARWWLFAVFVIGATFVAVCLADGGRVGERVLSTYFNLASLKSFELPRIPWTLLGWDAAKLAALAIIAPVLVLLWSSRSRLGLAAGCLLVAIVFADLFATGTVLTPSGSADLLVRRATEISAPHELGLARIFKLNAPGQFMYGETDEKAFRWAREGLIMSWPIADHVFAVNAEGNFKSPGIMNLERFCDDPGKPSDQQLRLLHIASTDRLVVYPDIFRHYVAGTALAPARIAPLTEAMPRAYVVGGPWMLDAERDIMGGLTNGAFQPSEAALVERAGPWAEEFSGLAPGRVAHEVTRIEYGADWNSLAIDLRSEREGILVVTDAWCPGWCATVNGRSAPIARVNALMRGVRVPAGESSVVMTYAPWTLRAGIIVSLAALSATILGLIFARAGSKAETK